MTTTTSMIAVRGKSAGQARSRNSDRIHLSQDGQSTLCGLVVCARVNHLTTDLTLIADCHNCWRTARAAK